MSEISVAGEDTGFTPADPAFETRVRESFSRMPVMHLLGARLTRIAPGFCIVEAEIDRSTTQQHGFVHSGILSTLADTAGGYAAFSLFPDGVSVLAVEFKINLLRPAKGKSMKAVGRVLKPGRTVTVSEVDVLVRDGNRERLCARMVQTAMAVGDRSDITQVG